MHRHSARLLRVAGGTLAAVVIAPWLGGAVASAADDILVSGDDRATAVPGNIHDDPEHAGTICEQLGFGADIQVGADNAAGYDAGGIQFDSDGTYLDAVSVPAGKVIDVVVVKAGDAYNRYDADVFAGGLPVNDMHAPLVGNDTNVPNISHWAACIGEAPPTVPSATVTPGCDKAVVHLDAGSNETTFVIDHDGATQNVTVAGGETQDVDVNWSGESSVSVTVLEGEGALDSQSRDTEECDTTNTVANPGVSFSNACKSGISVVLTNMDATAPVTFTVTAGDVTDDVKVNADKMVKLQFPVDEDSTGSVSVSAPGLSETSHSYAKDCTEVLGEKTVRTPKTPQAAGEQQQLPFTGVPAGATAALAALLLAIGSVLTYAGRRRTARHASS